MKPWLIVLMLPCLVVPSTARPQDSETEISGEWTIFRKVDPITDEVSYQAGVWEEDDSPSHGFVVFCNKELSSTGIIVGWLPGEFHFTVDDSERVPLIVRFDKREPRSFRTLMATSDVQPKVYLYGQDGAWFVEEASVSERVVLRVEIDGSEVTKIYSLQGSSQALSKLSCVQEQQGTETGGARKPPGSPEHVGLADGEQTGV